MEVFRKINEKALNKNEYISKDEEEKPEALDRIVHL